MDTFTFKLALRNILRNKLSSTINILGFSIGIASCLFIFLFISYETSFDKFYPDADRIYRILGEFSSKEKHETNVYAWFPVAPDIKNEIPGINAYCRISDFRQIKCFVGEQVFSIDKASVADENIFSFFGLNLKIGNPQSALNAANNIVLTENTAHKIFGNANPIGEIIIWNHTSFTVTGILVNPPLNTHLNFDALFSIKYIEQSNDFWKEWGGGISFLSYLRLSEGINPQQIETAMPDFLYRKINKNWENFGLQYSISLQNIKNVHITNKTIEYDIPSTRSVTSMFIISSISLLILLLVIINYVMLYTAQKLAKSKDIGILKLHGASRFNLIIQTFIEVLCISLISTLIGILLLEFALPFLNNHLQTSVSLRHNIFSLFVFSIPSVLLLSAIITFLSTFRLITSKTIDIIRENNSNSYTRQLKSNLLISFQFAAVILLLVSVFVISRQNKFLSNKYLGFNKENIISIQTEEEISSDKLIGFKHDLQQIAAIQSVCLSSEPIGTNLTKNGYTLEGSQESSMLNVVYTDEDFLSCFEIKLVDGKNFSANSELNKDAIIVNQQLVKKSGWKSVLDKTIERDGKLRIIGVVNDFNFASLENSVQPLIIMANPAWDGWNYSVVNFRFKTSDNQSLLSQIDDLWKSRFPGTPYSISALENLLDKNYQQVKSQQKLISFFSYLSIFIALIGLFGLNILNTRKRTKEIGIRKVNGAKSIEIITMLGKDILKWILLSFLLATPIAWYAMNTWLESFAYKTDLSWWIFALAGILVCVAAIMTVSLQALKTAKRNPVEALRYE